MKPLIKKFFGWYEKYTEQNVLIASGLFLTQAAHLTWLALFVIAGRLTGQSLWEPSSGWETILIIVDYFEIPALIATTILYTSMLRQGEKAKRAVTYLVFINLQWLHILWITDEFVVGSFNGSVEAALFPAWLAWTAIFIDYLEFPVMIDTTKRSVKILKQKFAAR